MVIVLKPNFSIFKMCSMFLGWRWYYLRYYPSWRSSCCVRTIFATTDASNFDHFCISSSLGRCRYFPAGPDQVCSRLYNYYVLFYIQTFLSSTPVDVNDRSQLLSIIKSCLGTKFINRWSEQACKIALDAVTTVVIDENGRREIDIKRYAKVEKVGNT